MLKWISNIIDPVRPEERDAARIYAMTMTQSRRPEFFGKGRIPDSYDGRIDVLSLNLTLIMAALRDHGEDGQKLSQSLYDHMVDDFDIALREEGLSDTGVKRRIKPMAALFFTRAKQITEALEAKDGDLKTVLSEGPLKDVEATDGFRSALTHYCTETDQILQQKTLGQIASADFTFADLTV